jgi:DNA-binding LacI/PurR family transcriptional regulator
VSPRSGKSEAGHKVKRGPIASGRVTAREVAELAGVSISAVSRAFTTGASVSPGTRHKVIEAARFLGYEPNLLARSLMTRRTALVGLISNNFENPYFMEIFDLFTRTLQQRGLRPLLANLSDGYTAEEVVRMLLQYRVDGVIVASSVLHRDISRACVAAGLPTVQAFGRSIVPSSAHVVAADNVQGGRLAGEVLLQHGYRKIAFLGGPIRATSTQDRVRGLKERLAADGLELGAEIYGEAFSYAAGNQLMRTLQDQADMDAVFCGNDVLALGAVDACRERGIAIPGDLGVIGFDDIPIASWSAYDLTTIRQPIKQITAASVEMVVSAIEVSTQPKRTQIFQCEAVIRKTLRERPRS